MDMVREVVIKVDGFVLMSFGIFVLFVSEWGVFMVFICMD